jgi:hypothetical protein
MIKKAHASAAAANGGNLIYGTATLVRLLYEGRDITPIWDRLLARATADPHDAAAFLDLSVILLATGQKGKAASVQQAALASSRTFEVRHGDGTGLRILAFVTAGDFMANTPIDFLLEDTDAALILRYVDADTKDLDDVPSHDVAFIAVGESEANRLVLENLERLLRDWNGPILNNAPRRIMALTRDGVAQAFADEPSILAPPTIPVLRDALQKLAAGQIELGALLPGHAYPVILRPLGTHAGDGMERIADQKDLAAYLAARQEPHFYIAPFIEYSGPDGLFRKQRIAIIDGEAFASHLAISNHWMVHYLSAAMAEHEERRAEEAAWMENFRTDFAARHASAFDALYRRIGLDYFAIDCAELPDGRLLLFEADVAMIVHAMDSEAKFPYKKRAMRELFDAFGRALLRRVARTCSSPGLASVPSEPPIARDAQFSSSAGAACLFETL